MGSKITDQKEIPGCRILHVRVENSRITLQTSRVGLFELKTNFREGKYDKVKSPWRVFFVLILAIFGEYMLQPLSLNNLKLLELFFLLNQSKPKS